MLEASQHSLDPAGPATEQLGHAVERSPQIARLVEQIEEKHRNDPVALVAQVSPDLLKQMLAQGARPGCSLV